MPLFRRHRGQLSESLKTTVIVKNIFELRDYIHEDWAMWEDSLKKDGGKFNRDSFEIKIEPYGRGFDERCGWYTQIVSCDFDIKGKFMAVGFLSEPLSQEIKK